jgi:hypothetical protein
MLCHGKLATAAGVATGPQRILHEGPYLADILGIAEPPLRPACNCIVAPHTVAGGCWPQLRT